MIPAMTVRRGDTLTWTITVTGNLTGWTPRIVVKKRSRWEDTADTAAALTLTPTAGLTLLSGVTTSTIDVTVSATATAALKLGMYAWDLQLSLAGEVRTVEWDTDGNTLGTLTVVGDVTRTTP